MSDKKERIWYDPPGVEPETLLTSNQDTQDKWKYLSAYTKNSEGKARRWRIIFVGLLYTLTGAIMYILINYSELPVETLPSVFFWAGGLFLVLGGLLYKNNGERRWGK